MISLAVLQFNPVYRNPEKNYQLIEKYLSSQENCLIVLPELCTTGYLFESVEDLRDIAEEIPNGSFVELLSSIAKNKNLVIVAGVAERENDSLYNSAVIISPRGFIGKYRKINLFYKEKMIFNRGSYLEVFNIDFMGFDLKVGVMICFDWFFPEVCRYLKLKGANVIAHPANLVLPYCPKAMPIRALENKVYTITANRIGVEKNETDVLKFIGQSTICSPNGQYLLILSENDEGVFSSKVNLEIDENITKYNNLNEDLSILRSIIENK